MVFINSRTCATCASLSAAPRNRARAGEAANTATRYSPRSRTSAFPWAAITSRAGACRPSFVSPQHKTRTRRQTPWASSRWRKGDACAVDVSVGNARQASGLPRGGDPGASGDRPALPRTRCGHDGGAGRALAGQRRLSHQLQRSLRGLLHQQRAAAFHQDMRYAYRGDPELGRRIAECANAAGVGTRAHEIGSLELEYGTLVPMRYERRRPFQGGVGGCLVRLAHAGGQPTLRRRAAPGDRAERQPCGGAGQRLAVASLQRQRQRRSHHARDQPGVLPAGGLARGGSVAPGRLEDLLRHAAGIRGPVRGRGRHARYRHAVGPAGLGCLRPAGGDRHRVLPLPACCAARTGARRPPASRRTCSTMASTSR